MAEEKQPSTGQGEGHASNPSDVPLWGLLEGHCEDGTGAAESGGNTSLTATLPQDWRSFVSFLTGQSHG